MACDPQKGFELLLLEELCKFSAGEPADVMLVVFECLLRPLFLLSPSFCPIFFQPVLCALMARWRVPGEALKPQSEVGGVVGGVMGSSRGDPALAVSSESPASGDSLDDEAD
jgi:hypothetical protein